MMQIEAKLEAMGLVLPQPPQAPPGFTFSFAWTRVRGNRVYIAGHSAQAPNGKAVGVDVGLEFFATLSDGTQIANPRYYRAAERKLKQAQRRLFRRAKGSNRRRKARELLAKAHLKIKRARQDFAHKTARVLVNDYDHIAVEKLNIRNMVRNHPLAKSISDVGWGIFLSLLIAGYPLGACKCWAGRGGSELCWNVASVRAVWRVRPQTAGGSLALLPVLWL